MHQRQDEIHTNQLSSSAFSARADVLLERSIKGIEKVSRTFQGISDTSISEQKRSLNLKGEELSERVAQNFREAVHYLLDNRHHKFSGPAEAEALIRKVAELCNSTLMQEPFAKRTWPGMAGHPAPDKLAQAEQVFYEEFVLEYNKRAENPLRFAAWIEQRYNHELHPLFDGCGRVSKALAVFALIEDDKSYPEFSDREAYIAARGKGMGSWIEYFRQSLPTV